jgi:hypothetical protein
MGIWFIIIWLDPIIRHHQIIKTIFCITAMLMITRRCQV